MRCDYSVTLGRFAVTFVATLICTWVAIARGHAADEGVAPQLFTEDFLKDVPLGGTIRVGVMPDPGKLNSGTYRHFCLPPRHYLYALRRSQEMGAMWRIQDIERAAMIWVDDSQTGQRIYLNAKHLGVKGEFTKRELLTKDRDPQRAADLDIFVYLTVKA